MFNIYPQNGLIYVTDGKIQKPTGYYKSLIWAIFACIFYEVKFRVLECTVASGEDNQNDSW